MYRARGVFLKVALLPTFLASPRRDKRKAEEKSKDRDRSLTIGRSSLQLFLFSIIRNQKTLLQQLSIERNEKILKSFEYKLAVCFLLRIKQTASLHSKPLQSRSSVNCRNKPVQKGAFRV
jgi:hypothetical protein